MCAQDDGHRCRGRLLPALEHSMTASLAADMADDEPWPTPKQSRRGEGGVPAATTRQGFAGITGSLTT
jgi:hypothetical protein